ncbi:unnamed protein product, partial [Oikopleura dioica]
VQHYINFMKQKNGRWEAQKVSDGGQDYFVYRDQSWMVPINFDDINGSAVIKVKILFENVLDEQYDFIVMKLPYHELHLNSETKEATILNKSASGRKRIAPSRKPVIKKCKKDKEKEA